MKVRQSVVFGIVFLGLSLGPGGQEGPGWTTVLPSVQRTAPRLDLMRLPLSFEENIGQAGGPAKFIARGPDCSLFLGPSEAVMRLHRSGGDSPAILKIAFEGASRAARMSAEGTLGGVSHYFIGSDPAAWQTNIPHYAKVRATDIYPGIDLVYYGNQAELEFDLVVEPGADPSQIVLAVAGARTLEIDPQGNLLADTGEGTLCFRRPTMYQGSGPHQRSVDGAFVLRGPNEVAFEVDVYDPGRPLVIDPAIVYATFFGSGGYEWISKIAVDSAGNLCFAGATNSAGFPAANALYPSYRGGMYDAFVTKLNAAGNALIFSTFFGGSSRDNASGIAVDAAGDIYLTGETSSTDFPLVSAIQGSYGGQGSVGFGDAFVAKMKGDGSALLYSTYLGGTGDEIGGGIAVDGSKNAYVIGATESGNFPTANAYQPAHRGGKYDAYVTKLNAGGSALSYSTYLGGGDDDASPGFGKCDIAVTSDGSAAVTSHTMSANFPVLNAFQATPAGGTYVGDAFITKLDPSGQSLAFSTFLGGGLEDRGSAVATDAAGRVYVTGKTSSTDFPTVNPYQAVFAGGDSDAFVAAFGADGAALYATHLGGSGGEDPSDITVNALGNSYVAGVTSSLNFPTVDHLQGALAGTEDVFVTVFSADGSSLAFSSYLGGTGNDFARAVRLDGDGNIYVAGKGSGGFPIEPSPSVFNGELFLAKIEALALVPGPTLTTLSPSAVAAGHAGFTLAVTGEDFVNGAVVRWDGSDRPTAFVSGYEVDATIGAADLIKGKAVQVTVRNPDTGISNALTFTINNPVPTMGSVSPATASGGCAALTLTVTGSSFVPNSIVRWNGADKPTTYISGTELQATIDTSCLAAPGDAQVTVVNPAPAGGTSTAAVFTVAGYAVVSSPTSATVTAGQSASYTVSLTPQFGSFDSPVTFSCTGLPNKCAATFAPTSVTPGAAPATTTLTLATQASTNSTAAALSRSAAAMPPISGLALLVLALVLAPRLSYLLGRRVSRRWLAACALLCLVIIIGGCSSGGDGDDNPPPYNGTPKGTYSITVRAVAGNLTVTTPITLVVN